MKQKKKICKTCKEEKFMWSRRWGCRECSNGNKKDTKPKVKKVAQKIKQVSSYRARQNQAYTVLRKTFLNIYPQCAVFPELEATEIHHSRKRNGERLLDTTFWFAVSRKGHNYIHDNPKESYEKGWLIKG